MINIEGYSGCGIRLLRDPQSREYILEKSTAESSYVPRLLKQQEKQASFHLANKLPNVIVPPILYVNQTLKSVMGPQQEPTAAVPQGCAVGMRFAHHTDAISFLMSASVDDIRSFSLLLREVLQQDLSVSPVQPFPSVVFVEKLRDIQRICKKNPFLTLEQKQFVCDEVVETLIPSIPEGHMRLPVGRCHGDLTLSNILVQPRLGNHSALRIVLIDFLDNFVESPLADMAKLCQDLKYAWTVRLSEHQGLDTIQLFTILTQLRNDMECTFSQESWYQQYFSLMFVVNQLRVLQYCKSAEIGAYLVKTVKNEFEIWKQQQQ